MKANSAPLIGSWRITSLGSSASPSICRRMSIGARCRYNESALVRRQAVENQIDWLLAMTHQFAQQLHEQLAVESALVGAEPEFSTGADRGCCRDRLSLPGSVNNGCLTAPSPSLTVDCVSSKIRFIPKQNRCAAALCLLRQSRIRLLLPAGNRFRVTLVARCNGFCGVNLERRRTGDLRLGSESNLEQNILITQRAQTPDAATTPAVTPKLG